MFVKSSNMECGRWTASQAALPNHALYLVANNHCFVLRLGSSHLPFRRNSSHVVAPSKTSRRAIP